jgi:endonuclease/exonuclease/phosphatase family metal-dependent hydrolase
MTIRDHGRRLLLAAGMLGVLGIGMAMLSASPPTRFQPLPEAARTRGPSDLAVLTYNVKGLPWPVAINRAGDLQRIGERLAAYRRSGRQPAIVVLQEAFTADAKRIAVIAGYAHVVTGPSRDEAPAAPGDPAQRAFVRAGSVLAGEGIGKQLDSGLMILSDYPVLAVRRVPFPAHACAGFDCLANKGMVMALVRPPGADRPVAVIATHLNARTASGANLARAFQAWRWQVEALDGLIRSARAMQLPAIVAGDLNVGKSPARRALIQHYAARWSDSTGDDRGTLDACLAAPHTCWAEPVDDARRALRHNKDWQIAVPGGGAALRPAGVEIPFGREGDGGMLSDHIGYVVHYRPTRPALGRARFAAG